MYLTSNNAMALEVFNFIGHHDGNFVLSSSGREDSYRMMICSDLDAIRKTKTTEKTKQIKKQNNGNR